jgi:phosphoribosylglycinamide formyltransferase 1
VSKNPKNIVVAISGAGRSLESLIQYSLQHRSWQVSGVISSGGSIGGHAVAARCNLPLFVGDFSLRQVEDTTVALKSFLRSQSADLIVLAGFLKMFPALTDFDRKVINIHPALLPKFGGHGMYGMRVHQAVIDSDERESGATVHFVNEKYDEGQMISQVRVPRNFGDDSATLARRVFIAECGLLPWTIDRIFSNQLPLEGGAVATMPWSDQEV